MPKKKNNCTHKKIFTWFGNFPASTGLQGFHYYQGKIKSVAVQFFTLSKTTTRNPNHQNNSIYILCTGLTMGYKMGQNFFKSPIKNHATLFWVESGRHPNQTQLGSTKPNTRNYIRPI